MEPIIRVKNIGKKYKIGNYQGGYVALRDVIMTIFKSPFQFLKKKVKSVTGIGTKEEFWALRDVSFDVMPGEVVGVIGKNGAGKSTLLKILTSITPPTTGEIEMRGRISSLLEVGTGFHPELTGRENIFLNGAILGMTRKEIAKNFDSIVEFAEIEKFLDTPVKYYSSGMYVRLAFSVAAHMKPDILLVDEVLAVGDAEFQKKCLGKMEEVTREQGRTILFVSHNMAAIERICSRCILLEKGKIVKDSKDVRGVIKEYLHVEKNSSNRYEWFKNEASKDNNLFQVEKMSLVDENKKVCTGSIRNDSNIELVIEATAKEISPGLTIGYAVYTEDNQLLYWSYQSDEDETKSFKINEPGKLVLSTKIPKHLFNEGSYRIEIIGGVHNSFWLFEPNKNNPEINFNVQGGLSTSPYWTTRRPGLLAPVIHWDVTTKK
jgi:lipopolysaccharide transport system ATP-binding protein